MRIPDYTAPITAFRFWILSTSGYLYPISVRTYLWPPRQAAVADESPRRMGDTGFWACKAPNGFFHISISSHCLRHAPPNVTIDGRLPPDGRIPGAIGYAQHVVGQVALWGEVIEHEYGYRAQYAYPVNIHGYFNGSGLRPVVRELYGVPVIDHPSPEALATAFHLSLSR